MIAGKLHHARSTKRGAKKVLVLFAMAWLAACGGGGSGGSSMSNSSSSASSTGSSNDGGASAQSCSGSCGMAVISLTDAAGDFLSYPVSVVSLQLTRADGTVVQTVPLSTSVDFAQLVDLSEILSAHQIPAGQYVSASITLNYSDSTLVVYNGTTDVPISGANIINGANGEPLTGMNAEVTLTLNLNGNTSFVVTPGAIQNLALDFNLANSNTILPSDTNPMTVTVKPVLSASLAPDPTKSLHVRGELVSVSPSATPPSFVIDLRPFMSTAGSFGQFTVDVSTTTTYSINGTSYTGSAGLTALAALPADTLVAAYGTWSTSSKAFTASSVLAGSSVPGTSADSLTGDVTARSGDTLTVHGAFIQHRQAGFGFAPQATVTLGSGTTVTEQGQSGTFSISDISVGQKLQVSGTLGSSSTSSSSSSSSSSSGSSSSGSGSGSSGWGGYAASVTLDASAGSAQLLPTAVAGTVSGTSAGQVTLVLQSIDRIAASNFNFAGTGSSAANDATAGAYTVALASGLSAPANATPVEYLGFVAPFGAAPPDFNAFTQISFANTAALLQVVWNPGDASPFTTLDSTEILISPAALQASTFDFLRLGFESINLSSLSSGLELVPDATPSYPLFLIAHQQSWKIDSYATFAELAMALGGDLTSSTTVLQIAAQGPYSASTGVLTADQVEVLLSD